MSWLPLDMKKSIVMIGEPDEKSGPSLTARPIGSGALVIHKKKFFVVTAKHVIEDIIDPIILFNNVHGRIKGYRTSYLSKKFEYEWKYHADNDIDLAILRFGLEGGEDDIKFISPELFIKFNNVHDGEDVFFMGFPHGLTNMTKITPAIRQGCVSLKFDTETIIGEIRYAPKTIIIDGQVSGGNSGGPVFRKPTISPNFVNFGTSLPSLFGIVTSHIETPIKDLVKKEAIAKENSGLGIISATDHIITLLDQY